MYIHIIPGTVPGPVGEGIHDGSLEERVRRSRRLVERVPCAERTDQVRSAPYQPQQHRPQPCGGDPRWLSGGTSPAIAPAHRDSPLCRRTDQVGPLGGLVGSLSAVAAPSPALWGRGSSIALWRDGSGDRANSSRTVPRADAQIRLVHSAVWSAPYQPQQHHPPEPTRVSCSCPVEMKGAPGGGPRSMGAARRRSSLDGERTSTNPSHEQPSVRLRCASTRSRPGYMSNRARGSTVICSSLLSEEIRLWDGQISIAL